jgi:hypothetical protein
MNFDEEFAKICKQQNIRIVGDYAKDIIDNCRYFYQLGQEKLAEREKQIVMLRDVMTYFKVFIESEQDDEYQAPWVEKYLKALAATADLSGLVLCYAVPYTYSTIWEDGKATTTPLYIAKEPK